MVGVLSKQDEYRTKPSLLNKGKQKKLNQKHLFIVNLCINELNMLLISIFIILFDLTHQSHFIVVKKKNKIQR